MRGVVGKVEEEGLVVLLLFEESDGVVGESIGGVIWRAWSRKMHIVERQASTSTRLQIARGSSQDAIKMLEASLQRPFLFSVQSDMPFARHIGMVSCIAKHLGHRHAIAVQEPHISVLALMLGVFSVFKLRVFRHCSDAGLMGIEACQQACSGGTGASAIVELREAKPSSGQSIDIGCRNLASVASNVGIAHVVSHDEQNVRTLVRFLCRPAWESRQQRYSRKTAFDDDVLHCSM